MTTAAALQLGLFDLPAARARRHAGRRGLLADTPRARRDDPETSHEAADWVRRSGVLRGHQQLVLGAVRKHPGATYLEIATASGLDRHAVARRLKELEPFHVKRGEIVRRPGQRPLLTWWPAT